MKTKEAIFITDEIIDFTRDRRRERAVRHEAVYPVLGIYAGYRIYKIVRHYEGDIEDHHHVRPSPTFNLASCHQYILLEPLLIQVSLNNKNWYQI